jgi:primosomal protein N' (replication factor Y) (superfamily II helicase)
MPPCISLLNTLSCIVFADVILPINLPNVLTYGVPIELHGKVMPGMRVEVGLGKNKQYAAVVERIHTDRPEGYQVKPIKGIIDEAPVLSPLQLLFWRWICDYYVAAPGEVMNAALPAHLKLMAETRIQWIAADPNKYNWTLEAWLAVDTLALRSEVTISELRAVVGVRHFAAVLNELLEQEAIGINDELETPYKPKKEKHIILAAGYNNDNALEQLFQRMQNAPKQLAVLMAYVELSVKEGSVLQTGLIERSGASSSQIKTLVDKGIFTIEQRQISRLPGHNIAELKSFALTEAQATAYCALETALNSRKVALLHGVTGSGKTLLYIKKIKEVIAQGQQALLLLPEIGLTTHIVARLVAYFGDDIGVYHSNFSNNERVEIWEKVRKHQYKVVVGPRSAIWLPFTTLGIVVIDEEHDSSYKQRDPAPRFHARDAAIYLASLHNAQVLLGSATPSVESLYNVQLQKYAYVPLKERYRGVNLPEMRVVSGPQASAVKAGQLLSNELNEEIIKALQQKKQVILFQNRRGYSPFQLCTTCGWVPQCRQCSVSLTYHKSTDKMHCHYCGTRAQVVSVCAKCGSNTLVAKSFGTEKIEEAVRQLYPQARVARMDIDSMRPKNAMADLLTKVDKQKVDILVGTQMVVKGLDFAHVTLVGILSADSLLSFPDFRVNERAFQLMEQVSGRAGRADGNGLVLVQAYNQQHPVLEFVKNHDVRGFYRFEIAYRQKFEYPPFTRLFKVSCKHPDEAKAAAAANELLLAMSVFTSVTLQGPGPAIVARVKDLYIQEVWIKCPRISHEINDLKKHLRQQKQQILSNKGNGRLQIVIDVDPY